MSNLSIRAGGEPDQAFMNIEPTTQTAAALPFTLIDSHCHLHAEEYQGVVPQILANAAQAGVRQIVTLGTDCTSSAAAVALAAAYRPVFACVGVHPEEAAGFDEGVLACIAELARKEKVVAIGEIGLDYVCSGITAAEQQRVFSRQLALAKELNLPVVIHDRNAHGDIAACIRKAGHLPRGGVMHCFSGDLRLAQEMAERGFMIAFSGVLTFKNAALLREVARALDLSHLMLETDSPYLTPVPYRGKRNEPARLVHTARMLADLKGLPLAEVARKTTANTCKIFHLPEAALS